MKLSLLLLALLPTIIFSQITITSADFATAGDTVRMSTATDNSIDIVTTGPNQNWDYSYLTFNNQIKREYAEMSGLPLLVNVVFGSFAPTNYKATYFLPSTDLPINQIGSLLPVTIEDLVQYTKKTADSITSVGMSITLNGTAVPIRSDTIETRYKFPMNYGDVNYSRGYSKLDMNPIYNAVWLQYRQRLTEVDGWGSIITPYGTFDALRVKHTINEKDSLRIEVSGNEFWIPLTIPQSYIYEWITNGEQDALLRIVTSVVGGNEIVSSIQYRDFNLTAGIEELELTFDIYPNPASQIITVNNFKENSLYYIVDAKGSVVLNGTLNGQINIASLSPGNYELVVKSENQIGRKAFIKQD